MAVENLWVAIIGQGHVALKWSLNAAKKTAEVGFDINLKRIQALGTVMSICLKQLMHTDIPADC